MKKSPQNCLNCGSLKEKLAQNVLIVEIFLRAGQNSRYLKLWGQKMQLSQKKSLDQIRKKKGLLNMDQQKHPKHIKKCQVHLAFISHQEQVTMYHRGYHSSYIIFYILVRKLIHCCMDETRYTMTGTQNVKNSSLHKPNEYKRK